ncbi:MAG: arginine--tRNA ligase, partial [Methylophaga nitratireducenticrescens]
MKDQLKNLIESTLASLISKQSLPADISTAVVQLERTKDRSHGDFASNIAMVLAKPAKMNPRQIASLIVDALPQYEMIEKVEIAGPGFINFTLSSSARQQVVAEVLKNAGQFGLSQFGQGQKIQVEFVSANPTGPLHVGHGRGAAYGSVVSSLLKAVGFDVHREYYVNDAGRQMDILATSVWLRYLEKCGEQFTFPSNGYRGEYVFEIAETLKQQHGDALRHSALTVFENVPADEPQGGDKELHIDGLTQQAK